MDDTHDMIGNICFWVTGHSMGAGVANIVAAELLHGHSGINNRTDNVYCYTFASPNTFYLTDNVYTTDSVVHPGKKIQDTYREPRGTKYRCIFNIVNDDDFVPKLPMEDCGWTRYGRTASLSVKSEHPKHRSNLGINTTLGAGYKPITTNYNLYQFLFSYHGNKDVPNSIAKSFSNIFEDKNKMRYDTYYIEEIVNFTYQKGLDANNGIPIYTLPYQNFKEIGETTYSHSEQLALQKTVYEQKQKPAFLFQLVANGMHDYIVNRYNHQKEKNPLGNKMLLLSTPLPPKYNNAKNALLIEFNPIRLNAVNIIHPHYPESYYCLSKMINTTDFR